MGSKWANSEEMIDLMETTLLGQISLTRQLKKKLRINQKVTILKISKGENPEERLQLDVNFFFGQRSKIGEILPIEFCT